MLLESRNIYMACFTVSAVAAIGVGVARHIVKHHEKKLELSGEERVVDKFGSDAKWSTKLAYLEGSLFAGAFVLAGEHVLHGEVTPYPPFLTAAGEGPEAVSEMLTEMGTVGVTMLAFVVAAWAIGVLIFDFIKYRSRKKAKKVEAK